MKAASINTAVNETGGVLVMIHCRPNTGYAIGHLEKLFFETAVQITGSEKRVWFSYPSLVSGLPLNLPLDPSQVLEADPRANTGRKIAEFERILKEKRIEAVLAFDQQIGQPIHRRLRKAGVKTIVSYHGAPMSGLNKGLKLLLKRMQVFLTLAKPDIYIFESEAMRRTATHGRGVPTRYTRVIPLGVDCSTYRPDAGPPDYVYQKFSIPLSRKVFVYSGHMEHRKGVRVILQAAVQLATSAENTDIHFLFLGNQPGDLERLRPYYQGTPAEDIVTFGGYRNDIPEIFSSCHAGVIASTGWDSFTRSSVEMAASGLPLIVSNLQGLKETIEEGVTGYKFPPGDSSELVRIITEVSADTAKRESLSQDARRRILANYSSELQRERLIRAVRHAIENTP